MSAKNEPEVVVVTGASGGVGRAIAHAFAKRGAHVGLLARGQEGLDGAAREVEALGGQALVVPTDVADHEQVEAAAAAVEERFGEIDVWVNDAMATVFARFIDTEPEEFKRATEVTYLGAVYGTMAALKRMTARDQGKIVQVGSALAYRAIPLQAAYCGAKFGIRGFTDSIRTELLPRQEQGADHDGPAARRQHDAVQLVSLEACRSIRCRSRRSISRRSRPRRSTGPRITAAASCGSATAPSQAILGTKIAPSFADWYLAKTGIRRPAGQGHADRRRARRQPVRAGARARRPLTASSTTQAKTRSPQLWARPTAARSSPGLSPGSRPQGRAGRGEAQAMSPATPGEADAG